MSCEEKEQENQDTAQPYPMRLRLQRIASHGSVQQRQCAVNHILLLFRNIFLISELVYVKGERNVGMFFGEVVSPIDIDVVLPDDTLVVVAPVLP